MVEARSSIDIGHPAPHRDRAELSALAFGLAGAPFAWALQLFVNYGIASRVCFPGAIPQLSAIGTSSAWFTILVVELVALAVSVLAAVISYGSWRATRHEAAGETSHMVEAGEGRTRFLALWGLLTSVGFAIAIMFSLVGLFVVPLCGS
jgi:hypothetical protein